MVSLQKLTMWQWEAKASSNLRVIIQLPGKEETFLWEINDQQRLQRPSSSYVEAKHLVSNQARLQEIAEMTELCQFDWIVRS